MLLPLDASINSAKLSTASAKDDFRAFHFLSRSTGRRALKSNTKAEHSQVLWPLEPADQFMAEKIYNFLKEALKAGDVWEAMEYLMAARGLLREMERD